jgi:hypothetical protein
MHNPGLEEAIQEISKVGLKFQRGFKRKNCSTDNVNKKLGRVVCYVPDNMDPCSGFM